MALDYAGNLKVLYVPEIDDMEEPTDTEIDAGVDLTAHVPVAGVDRTGGVRNNSGLAMLDSGFIEENVGTWSESVTLTFTRDEDGEDDSDHPYNLFGYQTSGYIVTSAYGDPEEDSQVEVAKVESHEPQNLASAENEKQQFTVQFAVSAFERLATVVSGGS